MYKLRKFLTELLCSHIWEDISSMKLREFEHTEYNGGYIDFITLEEYAINQKCLICGKKMIVRQINTKRL